MRPGELDCRHGAGSLLLRLTAIGEVRRESGGAWLTCAAASFSGGREIGQSERYLLPRVTRMCLNSSLQEPKP